MKQRLIIFSFVLSLLIMAAKFYVYYLSGSTAILTDALESIINVVSAAFAYYSVYLASLPRDLNHPYGHGKIEFLFRVVFGLRSSPLHWVHSGHYRWPTWNWCVHHLLKRLPNCSPSRLTFLWAFFGSGPNRFFLFCLQKPNGYCQEFSAHYWIALPQWVINRWFGFCIWIQNGYRLLHCQWWQSWSCLFSWS